MKALLFFSIIFLVFSGAGCQKPVNIEAEKAAIIKMMDADDQDLLDGVVRSDSGQIDCLNIMAGKIRHLDPEENRAATEGLFERGKFIDVKNLEGPMINISPDGKMAWVAVQTRFTIAYTDSLGMEQTWQGTEARLEVYEKVNNEWEAAAVAQTY